MKIYNYYSRLPKKTPLTILPCHTIFAMSYFSPPQTTIRNTSKECTNRISKTHTKRPWKTWRYVTEQNKTRFHWNRYQHRQFNFIGARQRNKEENSATFGVQSGRSNDEAVSVSLWLWVEGVFLTAVNLTCYWLLSPSNLVFQVKSLSKDASYRWCHLHSVVTKDLFCCSVGLAMSV